MIEVVDHPTRFSRYSRNSQMRQRVDLSFMQWNYPHWKIFRISVRSWEASTQEKLSFMALSRQTYYLYMKQIRKANFSICLLLKVPEAHFSNPSQTSALLALAVAISLFLTNEAYLLRSSSVRWVNLRQSLALDCSVAKAWSILVISMKAASFLPFTLFKRCSFSFSSLFFFNNPKILYSFFSLILLNPCLALASNASNSSTLL